MAPEQYRIQSTIKTVLYDSKVDIFALALVILALLDTEPGKTLDALTGIDTANIQHNIAGFVTISCPFEHYLSFGSSCFLYTTMSC